jgi:hypothetical protein
MRRIVDWSEHLMNSGLKWKCDGMNNEWEWKLSLNLY